MYPDQLMSTDNRGHEAPIGVFEISHITLCPMQLLGFTVIYHCLIFYKEWHFRIHMTLADTVRLKLY